MSELLPDEVWNEIEPELPPQERSPRGGRPPVSHRQALTGIIFILKSGLPWNMLPEEMHCGSGVTCWRRFRDWTRAGLWERIRLRILHLLGKDGQLDATRAVIDSASVRAVAGGPHTGPNPTDRAKNGCKRHVITDANGLPLVVQTGPANERDDRRAFALLEDFPTLPGPCGRPRTRPAILQGDAGYGFPDLIRHVRRRRIRPQLAPRGKAAAHGSGLGKTRYVVERTLSWFGNFRRIKLCYERLGEHFQAFHDLAATLINSKRLLATT
jgi:transposase